jgi:Holliday junction resolvase RusA-like endonuclease
MTRSKTVGEAVAALLREGSGVGVRVQGVAGDPVSIPVPPSVNGLWRATRKAGRVRVYRSAAYTRWIDQAVPLLAAGLPVAVSPVGVSLVVRPGKGWRCDRDLDNCLKATLDAVRHAGRIPDDSAAFVRRVSCELGPVHPSGVACCEVAVTVLTGEVAS